MFALPRVILALLFLTHNRTFLNLDVGPPVESVMTAEALKLMEIQGQESN